MGSIRPLAKCQVPMFARACAADKKQQTRALSLRLIDGKRRCRAFAARRYGHDELARPSHGNELRSVKTKEDNAGRELCAIEHADITYRWPVGHRGTILATARTYSRYKIFNPNCDV